MAPTQRQLKDIRAKQLAGAKAPKAKVARYLKTLESKLVEEAKSALLLKGIRCSDAMTTVLKDLRAIKAPHAKLLTKNNVIVPFDDEGQQSLDFLCTKNDASLFAMASHNKKRPNNLTIGRTFDRRILDMCELGVLRYKSLQDYAGSIKKRIGSKPMMLFVGDKWHLDVECKRLQNLLIDFYRGDPVKKIIVSGLDHIMVFTIVDDPQSINNNNVNLVFKPTIHQRTYFVKLKKNPNGGKTPLPYLLASGPDMDFKVRRTQFATPDTWKMAMKQPAAIKPKKVKNHTTNMFGETIGRLHIEKQDIDKMGGKKSKALRNADKLEKAEQKAEIEADLSKENSEIGAEFKQTFGFDKNDMVE
uniref:Ribosome production factor 2 homolog n=1 Tax=Eucampia antarctica TaxID=49252 RepID=A0A7S2R2I5_9STRA|mmetsp:Transcript_14871/g.14332  ORF Transcript_14871/g.14332 Transcript_14871/m.14332 type:complete len:359 (+) Transcript_14871:106-1182(+)|eukprot:CAMPEP_0197831152 /NCGR_PEP_ID=MMETSP1437-20131217/7735_1 /TAXON_ID=49252 ORGANISM="Eucampia antarctica, Strain CCMP1452" /NCGR_SAMPLE_ID=MMETSP1437 /ASSEMBLY_ACC=CAM_ASM_001096 /LENGTH=358 /DNA_ID=CAMNT_0043433939 /DNA_START=105 /DNA_END=1181 /DNA_ORIENTATION=-